MKLEKPYSIKDLTTIDRVPDGNKRCRICKAVKLLTEFHRQVENTKLIRIPQLLIVQNRCSLSLEGEIQTRRRSLPVDSAKVPNRRQAFLAPRNPPSRSVSSFAYRGTCILSG